MFAPADVNLLRQLREGFQAGFARQTCRRSQ